ncbi:sulfotransferase family 2 domain-containing protein [Alteromonas sp. C1M14]|uniref:sulfotransferase family 2 domain-containing protein n=1 Tax=Alteromonas sp. C1M14 TaxID=2841567 RepID=UPI001C0A60A4|nr:sulfotransferase family 2 domain-containing protein [Alteromonas sp. C1M14]MBU2977227.1 sulfotransferase family 2 domain-containing protein [Alteromonas sp. C1M14]
MIKFFHKRKLQDEYVWFSHHIPKTAGTSLRIAYEKALGKRKVYKLYKPFEVKQAESGDLSMLPKNIKIVHGHFKPRECHEIANTVIKRAVWLRDPVQRAWSLMRHIISVQKHTNEYKLLKEVFGERLNSPDETIFHFFLTNEKLKHLRKPYRSYFSQFSLSGFDFVGVTENFAEDLERLSQLMNMRLGYQESNVRVNSKKIDTAQFKPFLKEEYAVVKKYIPY